jgi:hypothetical protein
VKFSLSSATDGMPVIQIHPRSDGWREISVTRAAIAVASRSMYSPRQFTE